MLEVRDLDLSIEGTPVLRQVQLNLAAGEMVGLIGRNGAGKTSLLRTVMGLWTPSNGSVRYQGQDLLVEAAHRRAHLGIGYMPEDRGLIPELMVQENVMVPAWATQREDHESRLRWIYSLIPEVEEFAQRKAFSVSGGQQKLVALARALMAGSHLLLLDEPFEGVAPSLGKRLVEVISALKDEGLSVLLAESDYTHTHGVVDRAYVIDRGSVAQAQTGGNRQK